jgi:hypothetical protein
MPCSLQLYPIFNFVIRVPNHVSSSLGLSNLTESRSFLEGLDLYARQSTRIMEDFAGGWYSRHNWESRGRSAGKRSSGSWPTPYASSAPS